MNICLRDLPMRKKSRLPSRVPTHAYADCEISGQQPTQLYKEFPRVHEVGHSKKNAAHMKGFKVASQLSGKGNVTLKCMCKYSSPKEHLRLDRTYTPNHGISCGFCDILGQAFERHSGPPASWLPALSALFGHPAPPVFSPYCWVGFEGRFHGQEK